MSRNELIESMRALAKQMLDVAAQMDFFGGMNAEIVQHAAELAGAAAIVDTWVEGMGSDDAGYSSGHSIAECKRAGRVPVNDVCLDPAAVIRA